MAEQTVRYRVELDDADLAQQLESIRNRLSEGVASYPNNLIQQPIPTFDQSQIYTAPLAYTPVSMPEQGNFPTVNVPNMLFNMPENSSTGYQMATNNFARFRENASTGFEQVRVSSSEFVNNVNAGSEMAFNNVENFGVKSSSKGMSLWDSGAASFGIGYDASMPVFRSDYRDFYSQEFANNAKSTIASGIENTITFGVPIAAEIGAAYFGGAAAAAVVGGVGTLAALPVAVGLIGAETKMEAIEQTSDNLFNIAMYTPAKMSKVQAESIATSLYDYTKTDEANLKNLDIEDLNAVIAQFGAAGGFSKTTDVASFTQKTSQLIQNFREFMHALNMAQEDAAALMGELEAKGISSAANAPIFAAQMQVQASLAGMPTNDLISYGLQMGDMLKSEGFNPMQGFDFAVDARTEMNRLLNSNNPYYKNAIYQAGGVDAATNNLMRFLGSSSGGGSVYDFKDYSNNPTGNNPNNNDPSTPTQPDDYFKILEDAAAMFSSDPLSVFKMLSVDKQVEATIGIKQRAQRNVSQALVGLNMVGYSKDKLSPQDIVGMMMTQAGGKLDAATAWQTYGLATSFTDYQGLSEQVNQLIATNDFKEEDYSLSSMLSNYFFGENSPLGATAGALTDIGVAAKSRVKSWSNSLVNGYEDIVDSATGKKRIHYEDFKNLSPDQFDLNNIMNKAFIENRVVNPLTGNVFSDDIIEEEGRLAASYDTDFLLTPGEKDVNAKIDAAFNFKNMHPFLRKLGIETFRDVEGKFDPKEFNSYSSYVHQLMTENGGTTQVAGLNDVLENLSFSGHLQNLGLKDVTGYATGQDKAYLGFRESFMSQLNDKSKSNPMDLILDPSAENYYDALSLRSYGKSFDNLNTSEQKNIHIFANDQSGGIKYLRNSGDLPDFLVDTVLPYMKADVSRFDKNSKYIDVTDNFTDDDGIISENIKLASTGGYGLGSDFSGNNRATSWLDAFQNYDHIFNNSGNKGLFDAYYKMFENILNGLPGTDNFFTDLDKLNEQFKTGAISFKAIQDLYDAEIEATRDTALVQAWKGYSPEQKAAYIARYGSDSVNLGTDTNNIINQTLTINDPDTRNFKVNLESNLNQTFKKGEILKGLGRGGMEIFIESVKKVGGKYKVGDSEYDSGIGLFGLDWIQKDMTVDKLIELNKNAEVSIVGEAYDEQKILGFNLMKELKMGEYTDGGKSFKFNDDYGKYAPLYGAAATSINGGIDFVHNTGLFYTQQQSRDLVSDDLNLRIKAAREVQTLNQTGFDLDMGTSLALNTKINSTERAAQISTLAQSAVDAWEKSETAQGKSHTIPEKNAKKKAYEQQFNQVVQGKEAQAAIYTKGMEPTNDLLGKIEKILAIMANSTEEGKNAMNALNGKLTIQSLANLFKIPQ
jgi:hypothetical protein